MPSRNATSPYFRSADRIVVLDHGRVVESGQYEDLIMADGAFAKLMAASLSVNDLQIA